VTGEMVPFIIGDVTMTAGFIVYLSYLLWTGKGRS
jgi:hypothetical protein